MEQGNVKKVNKKNAKKVTILMEGTLKNELKDININPNEDIIRFIISYLINFELGEIVQVQKSSRNKYLSNDESKNTLILYCIGYDSEIEANIIIRNSDDYLSQEIEIESIHGELIDKFKVINTEDSFSFQTISKDNVYTIK